MRDIDLVFKSLEDLGNEINKCLIDKKCKTLLDICRDMFIKTYIDEKKSKESEINDRKET